MAVYSVCVNAAGCLPDSETYPYVVNGVDAALEALENELETLQASVDGGLDRFTVGRQLADGVGMVLDLGGTYRLAIEPAFCLWFAGCQNKASKLRAGLEGDVPICERCDARIEAMT